MAEPSAPWPEAAATTEQGAAQAGLSLETDVRELLPLLITRPVIVGLAVLGAALVMAAGLLKGKGGQPLGGPALFINRLGYALTFVSVALFIVAGFLSGR